MASNELAQPSLFDDHSKIGKIMHDYSSKVDASMQDMEERLLDVLKK